MVTASHNPPRDNGYKVYLDDGSQIVSPVDVEIAAAIDAVDLAAIEVAGPDDPRIVTLDDAPLDAYLRAVPAVRLRPELRDVTVAYTPMHGVGAATLLAAFERAGWPRPAIVAEQAAPDPDFPTVAFPNPEEPGAMDLLLALAADGRRRRRAGQRSRRRPARRGHPHAGRRLAAADRRRAGLAPGGPRPPPHDRRGPAGGHHARLVVAAGPHGRGRRRAPRRDLHRVQVDRQDDPRPARRAVRVRLRAGARLPRGRPRRATRTASPRPCSWPRSRRWPRPRA